VTPPVPDGICVSATVMSPPCVCSLRRVSRSSMRMSFSWISFSRRWIFACKICTQYATTKPRVKQEISANKLNAHETPCATAYSSSCSYLGDLHPFCCNSLLKCALQAKIAKKITKNPHFGGLRSFKVIDVNTPGKLVSSALHRCKTCLRFLQKFKNMFLMFLKNLKCFCPIFNVVSLCVFVLIKDKCPNYNHSVHSSLQSSQMVGFCF